MFERSSGGRFVEGDFATRFARIARTNRVTFSFNEDRRTSSMGGIMSYFLELRLWLAGCAID